MNYKLRNNESVEKKYYSDIEGHLLEYLLKARGVKDVDALLNVSQDNVYHWSEMAQVDEVSDFMIENINKDTVAGIIVDQDCDGYTSTAVLKGYLKDTFNCESEIIVHGESRKHGINPSEIFDKELNGDIFSNIDILFVPDAGTSDINNIKELKSIRPELPICIFDHHELSLEESDYNDKKLTIKKHPADFLVNPKTCDYPNKELSGVGVVYKVCQAIDDKLDLENIDKYLPYIAFGMIGDMMDLTSYETRYIINKGLAIANDFKDKWDAGRKYEIEDLFMLELIEKLNAYKTVSFTFEGVSWEVSPIINAIARVGTKEETRWLIDAMTGSTEMLEYQPRRKSKGDPKPDIEIRTIQEEIIRMGSNARSKQNNWAKKITKQVEDVIQEKGLYNDKVILVDAREFFTKPIQKKLSGLIAGQIANKYQRPTIILKGDTVFDNKEVVGGSMRNFNNSPVERFKEDLNKHTPITSLGHQSAAGVFVEPSMIQKTRDILNELYKNYEMKQTYLVDFITRWGRINPKDIKELASHNYIFGGNIEKPRLAVKAIVDPENDIELLGSTSKILKISKDNSVDIIKFHGNEKDILTIKGLKKSGFNEKSYKRAELLMICEADNNEYNGNIYPQLIIKDYTVKEYKLKKSKRLF